MANKKHRIMLLIGALIAVQLACSISFGEDSQKEEVNEQTAVVLTVEALLDEKNVTVTPKQEEDALATITPNPTLTPTITNTPKPCNQAVFVSETIPDNTNMAPGATFTKTWRFRNTGTCTWNTNYKLLFKEGNQMSGPATLNFPNNVAPNETVDFSVNLKAPASGGTYKGVWRAVADNGEEFIHNIWAQIVVPSPAFAVTSVTLSAAPPIYHGMPPFVFTITANITVSAPGTVTYWWKRYDSVEFGHASIVFDAAGTKPVSTTVLIPAAGVWSTWIYIDTPNHQLFGPVNVTLAPT